MRSKILLFIGIVIFSGIFLCKEVNAGKIDSQKDTITILSTQDVFGLSETLLLEYNNLYPDLKFLLKLVEVPELKDLIKNKNSIGFISQETGIANGDESLQKILIGRDVDVMIMNSENPYSGIIEKKGLSAEKLADILKSQNKTNWGTLLGNDQETQVHFYIGEEETTQLAIMDFLKVSSTAIGGLETKKGKDMISTVQKDTYAIGFCKIGNIFDSNRQGFAEGIKLIPIDKNGNGIIDYNEKIYDNPENFRRGIWVGKYPRSLINNIYSVSSILPADKNVSDYLSWVLTDGQQFLELNGFTELVYNERQAKLDKLKDFEIQTEPTKEHYALIKIAIIIIAFFVVGGSVVYIINFKRRNLLKILLKDSVDFPKTINENSLIIPNGLYFDKTHIWSFMEKDGIVKVGVDDFLQKITGKYTRIKLKNPGVKIKRNEQFLTLIQKGKQLNIYSPISGRIKEINEVLVTDPDTINSAPYSEGWVYMIEPSNWLREIQFLKMAENYKAWIINEFSRLKDFLAISGNKENPDQGFVFQEGGELKNHVLKDFGPEVWEDFQQEFLD
jgi:glycine cleavage system H lipoate-binding protein/ABC-type phosphate transport system substrate-binding protein